MRCAIYARKSTRQSVAESTVRQVENARAFAAVKGWTVADDHVYVDEAVSGAETTKLAAKQRLLANLSAFHILVMQAPDRLSRRDGVEAFGELKSIAAAGVQIFFYADGTRFDPANTLTANVTGFLRAEFAAEFRRAIAQKTSEAMIRRAKLGWVTGKKCYGYDHVKCDGHVERVINPTEAAVVREIYKRYAGGDGYKAIAYALNAKARTPRWSSGSVRSVLTRGLYRGLIVYNKTKKRDDDGSRHRGRQPRRPKSEWVHVAQPELRIVDAATCEAVDQRLEARRLASPGPGRPKGSGVKHLLSGFIRCKCGAVFTVLRGSYMCSQRRTKGPTACTSSMVFPAAQIEQIFLDALEAACLSPKFINEVMAACASDDDGVGERVALVAERKTLVKEIDNLTRVVARRGDLVPLVDALSDRVHRLAGIDQKLATPVVAQDREMLRTALECRRADWQSVLRGPNIALTRQVLRNLCDLPMTIHNQARPKWLVNVKPEGILNGLIANVASPRRPTIHDLPVLTLHGPCKRFATSSPK